MELNTEILKQQLHAAFEMAELEEARSYLDSVALPSTALSKVRVTEGVHGGVKGSWFVPKHCDEGVTSLYLHGGGYSFYPRSFYDNLVAMLALTTKSKVFALDYRLTPEYKFPKQLEDALAAYDWLAGECASSNQMLVIGDSAGGNLTLGLLLVLRDSGRSLPGMAICLSPATDFGGSSARAPVSSECDWISTEMALQWAEWFCLPTQRSDPLVSPVNADLRGLPPIYMQAGGAEILLPGIQEFARRAKRQGAEITLETWPEMNHDFQAFGYDVPQSTEALKRIGDVVMAFRERNRDRSAVV